MVTKRNYLKKYPKSSRISAKKPSPFRLLFRGFLRPLALLLVATPLRP